LNVFQYVTFRTVAAAITSFLFCLWIGPRVIEVLRRLKLGQPLRKKEEVHKLADLHENKAGTPTMGGVLILFSLALSCVLWGKPTNPYLWIALGSTLALGTPRVLRRLRQDPQKILRWFEWLEKNPGAGGGGGRRRRRASDDSQGA